MSTNASARQPSEASLREAALRHLARYAATEQRLLRVLDRHVARWLVAAQAAVAEDNEVSAESVAAQAAAARLAARRVVAALAASGVVDDAAYAERRAGALLRAGKSRVAVARHLALRGIDAETVRAVVPQNAGRELAAALLLARRRRLGAFAARPEDAPSRRRALAVLARAGFSQVTAQAALRTPLPEAEVLIGRLRG